VSSSLAKLAAPWVVCAALTDCQQFTAPSDALRLPIADRQWAPGAPPQGWCGETSIQMAALHFGAWLPQRLINARAKPAHVDVWETEMGRAMTAVGVRFERWPGGRSDSALLTWIVAQLRLGHPVIVAVKLLPDQHPDQEFDHLMLAVGFTPTALVFNTNLEQGQAPVPYAAMLAKQGVALTSHAQQDAWAVTGLEHASGVGLRVVEESPQTVGLAVTSTATVLQQDDLDGAAVTVHLDGGLLRLPAGTAARFTAWSAPPARPE
jgi:hypothetical protein